MGPVLLRALALPLAATAVLGALAWLLDHGLALGLGRRALEAVGRVYVALLLGALLLRAPRAWRAGVPAPQRPSAGRSRSCRASSGG